MQISLLLPALEIPGVKVGQSDNSETHAVGAQIEMSWISVLWQRGFGHKNPQGVCFMLHFFPSISESSFVVPQLLNFCFRYDQFGGWL